MKKMKKIILLIAMAFICILTGITTLSAKAQTTGLTEDNFMVGAAVRLKKANEQTGDGLRFVMLVKPDVYETLDENFLSGVLLIPEKLSNGKELLVDITSGEPVANDSNISHTPTKSAGGNVNNWREYTDPEGEQWMMSAVYLWGIPSTAYDTEVLARGYIVNNGELSYTKTVARSIAYVADKALVDPSENWNDTERTTLQSYIPTYEEVNVESESGDVLQSFSTKKYGDSISYTPTAEAGKQFKVFYGDEQLDADEQGTYTVTVKNKNPIVVKEYLEVSSASEFLAMDLANKNYILTTDIPLGALNDSTGLGKYTKQSVAIGEQTGTSTMNCIFPILSKHLDGNGYAIEYSTWAYGGANMAMIGVVSGTISNLKVVANARTCGGSGVLAGHGWSTAVVENCEFNITDTKGTEAGTPPDSGLFYRFGGTMKNCVVYTDVKLSSGTMSTKYYAIATTGTFMNEGDVNSIHNATFKDVIVVAPSGQGIYNGMKQVAGVSVYNEKSTMLSTHDFSAWSEKVWRLEKDGDTVTDFYFGKPIVWTAISSEAEFKALNGKEGNYYLTKDLTFYVNGDSTNSGGWAVVHNFNAVLDGRGYTIKYRGATDGTNTQWSQAFIYNFNGKLYNLNFEASVNQSPQSATFAMILGKGSEISNCTFDITTKNNSAGVDSTYENTSASFCSVIRANVTVKNVIIKATAYKSDGTTANTVTNVFSKDTPDATAAFANVVIIADQNRKLTGATTQPSGLNSYATVEEMYSKYDFNGWDNSVWVIEKDGSDKITGVALRKN